MPSNQQTVAYQLEKVATEAEALFVRDYTLFDKIGKGKKLEKISTRAMRLPLDLLPGGSPSQINPDGGPMGRGSAIYSDYGQITSVFFSTACHQRRARKFSAGPTLMYRTRSGARSSSASRTGPMYDSALPSGAPDRQNARCTNAATVAGAGDADVLGGRAREARAAIIRPKARRSICMRRSMSGARPA